MRKLFSVFSLFALVSFVLLMVLQTGSLFAASDELPITTKSQEARKLFIEGRQLAEFFHTEKAYDLFSRAVEIDPEFALAYLFKAGTSTETKNFQDNLAKAVALAPKVSEGEQKLIAAFRAFYQENDALKASQIYQELATMFPKDKRIQWYLSGAYDSLQEYDKEIAVLERTLAIDKKFSLAYQSLGYVYRWRNQYDKAEANLTEYLRLNPKEANAHDNLADLYQKMGKFDEAFKHYSEAARMDPTFAFSQRKVGITLAFMGKYEEGRHALQKAMDMEIKPANKVYDQEAVARTYIYEGNYAKALEVADKAIQMANQVGLPETVPFDHFVKSALYVELNDYDKAEASIAAGLNFLEKADFVAAIKQNQRAVAVFWQAMVAAGRKDFKAALVKAGEYKTQIAAIQNPAIQAYPSWLFGCIALAQGDAKNAIQYFGHGEMDEGYFIYYSAVAKDKAGDKAGAAQLYRKAANWNIDSVWYAFVRQKASAKL